MRHGSRHELLAPETVPQPLPFLKQRLAKVTGFLIPANSRPIWDGIWILLLSQTVVKVGVEPSDLPRYKPAAMLCQGTVEVESAGQPIR